MHIPASPPRQAGGSVRALATLGALAATLLAAFVVAPRTLAAGSAGRDFPTEGDLVDAFRESFVQYWGAGARIFPPGLEGVVDYWFRYHLAKAVIAAALLAVLVALGVVLWRAFVRAGGRGAGRSAALAAAGVAVTMLALFSLAAVMANIQGAVAPFASLLPLLPVGETDGPLADTLGQVRQQLSASLGAGGQSTPALEAMVSDFARFHTTMAVIAAIVAAVFAGAGAVLWTRYAATGSSDRRARRVLGSLGVLSALLALSVIVVGVANTTTAADPAPALLAFFNGAW